MVATRDGLRLSGVMGDAEILRGIETGQIIIDPFDPDLLQSSSYDVRLGGTFYRAEAERHIPDFSPYDQRSVERYYKGPLQAITHRAWCEKYDHAKFRGIDDDEYIIVLMPGECLLCHTVEFIGAAKGATTMMKARSSLGRINISACDDAGWGDVGFIDRWTSEIRNKNEDSVVPLIVGMPFAQMVFFHVADAAINYADSGHYQTGKTIEAVKAEWSPTKMLPKLYSEKNRGIRRRLVDKPRLVF